MTIEKIAILGGGPAGLSTAFELTSHPAWQTRYEITVYQLGWRLGGKCASGCNRALGDRVEEHGLHVLYGWYENVFRMMRECYDELGRPPGAPLATWDEAVQPLTRVYVPEWRHERWHFDALDMPPNTHPLGETEGLTPWAIVRRLLSFAEGGLTMVRREGQGVDEGPQFQDAGFSSSFDRLRARVERLGRAMAADASRMGTRISRLLGRGADNPAQLIAVAAAFARALPADVQQHRPQDHATLSMLLDRALAHLKRHNLHAQLRRAQAATDLSLTIARGLIADRLLGPPIDFLRADIEAEDFRDWLLRHGAAPQTARAPLIDALYAAAFGTLSPKIGAGTLLHAVLRMLLTYKGSFHFWLNAGMGETIIAPLYQVLRRRGVRFRFFHSVNRLELSADRRRLERVIIDRQATPKNGEYQPLIDVQGLPCWPTEPLYDQLLEGEALRSGGHNLEDFWTAWPGAGQLTLEAGRDFDRAVLAISAGAFPYLCKELIEDRNNPRFAAMVTALATTSTQSLQLWIDPDRSRLGWAGASRPIMIPFAEPFDTWADMSHLLDRERWPSYRRPGSLHYFCAAQADVEPLPPREDRGYHERQLERVRREASRWLSESAAALWPPAARKDDPRAFNFHLLSDPEEREGEARLAAQYFATPAHPSDRYVLSVPGSSRFRLRADESGYPNLILAGDWTKTSLSIGCLECAVMAGHNAAQTLFPSARPALWDWLWPLGARVSSPTTSAQLPTAPAPAVSKLPKLRPFDGSLVVPAPVGLSIRVYSFVLAADEARLQAMCDRYLNLGGPQYRPLGPFVILYCASIDNYPLVDRIGWCPELDFGFWVPLEAGAVRGGRYKADRIVTFTPYIWVDNAPALLGGREVFGFAKQLGRLTMPGWEAPPEHFAVDTLVLPRHAPETLPVEARVLEIHRSASSAGLRPQPLAGFGPLAAMVRQSMRGLRGAGVDMVRPLARFFFGSARGMRMVFLKQLPDVDDGTRACYQALIEGELPILGRPALETVPGEFTIRIQRYDSLRIAEQLGLSGTTQPDGSLICTPYFQGRARFDSRAERGTVVHRTV